MKTTFTSLALFVAGVLAQNSFTINTPSNVVECEPTLLAWSGGVAPYFLSILPGSTPTAPALENLGQQNGNSVTWTCNIAAGVSLGLTLRDSTGAVAQSAPFTVNPGSSTACLNTTSLVPGPTGSAPSSSAGGSSTPATTSPGASTVASTPAGSSTSSSPTTSPNTGAASSNAAHIGAAGVVGAAVAALLL